MRRQVKSGGLPISVGAVVQNVATALAVYEAVQKNKPLITNTLTVTGDCLPIEKQHNYLFRIGTPLSFIAEYAGGVPESAAKIISGGPMMGKAISNLDAATVKGSSSIRYHSKARRSLYPLRKVCRCLPYGSGAVPSQEVGRRGRCRGSGEKCRTGLYRVRMLSVQLSC